MAIKKYYRLTKPGMVRGNLITATGGFLLASQGHINVKLLLATLGGLAFIIASACVYNNFIDRDIDKKMKRTKKRALATGTLPSNNAILYASVLGVIGFLLLSAFTNPVTVLAAFIGFIDYVVFYGIAKRKSVHGTLVGTISGAMPIVAGYTAVSGQFDLAALLLFLVLVTWQMPHFYAIAIRRREDYKAAGIPVMPVKLGNLATKHQMVLYIIAFILATEYLTLAGFTGKVYLIVMLLLGLYWLKLGFDGFNAKDDVIWAKKMFLYSLIVLLSFCSLISIEFWLP